jgi:organic radical activating enzyme
VEPEYKDLKATLAADVRIALENGEVLPVMEDFYTIQGEGGNTGYAAYFIRLGGCDVGCHWCDVKESWNPTLHPLTPISEVVNKALSFKARSIVITGGEPLLYNLEPLTQRLKESGLKVFLETSGAYSLSGNFDWVCLSPKKFKKPLVSVLQRADELKVIVFNKSDFEWAEQFRIQVGANCLLFLQPEWSKSEQMLPQIIDFVKENPHWRISLQTHKYMNIP